MSAMLALATFMLGVLVSHLFHRHRLAEQRQAFEERLEIWQLGNAQVRQHYAAELERIHAVYAAASKLATETVVATASAVQFAGAKGEAEVEQTPDAEIEMRKRVHEDSVRVGIERLRTAYQNEGIAIGDAELRAEAEMMLLGQSPMSSVAVPLVRD